MKIRYDLHKDFRFVRLLRAPVRPFSVAAYNFINTKAIEGVSREADLPVEKQNVLSSDGSSFEITLVKPESVAGEAKEAPSTERLPCLVYYHGGGFRTKAVLPQFTRVMEYAKELGCLVVMPDYRLIPKNPYPKGFEDTMVTLDWLVENERELGIDLNKVILLGDSAGGKLAASVALKARDINHRIKPLAMFLIYPVTDHLQQSKSIRDLRFAPIWNRSKNRRMWRQYLKNGVGDNIGYASPLYAEHMEGLPETYVEVAENDCLRDEGIKFCHRLKKAGVKTKLIYVKKAMHGYDSFFYSEYVDGIVKKRIKKMKEIFEGAV